MQGVHPPIILPPLLPPPLASFIKLSVGHAIYSIAWQVAADVGGGVGGKEMMVWWIVGRYSYCISLFFNSTVLVCDFPPPFSQQTLW